MKTYGTAKEKLSFINTEYINKRVLPHLSITYTTRAKMENVFRDQSLLHVILKLYG